MNELKTIPYTAISLSVVGRFIFMYLLYKNKSTSPVLHSKHLFIQYVGLLQRANARCSNDFSKFHGDFSVGYIIRVYHSE